MTAARTPNTLYHVRQALDTLFWQVVPVDRAQGEAMRRRKEPHVYDTAAQAHAVRLSLNAAREGRSPIVLPGENYRLPSPEVDRPWIGEHPIPTGRKRTYIVGEFVTGTLRDVMKDCPAARRPEPFAMVALDKKLTAADPPVILGFDTGYAFTQAGSIEEVTRELAGEAPPAPGQPVGQAPTAARAEGLNLEPSRAPPPAADPGQLPASQWVRRETRAATFARWEAIGITDPACPACQRVYYSNPQHPIDVTDAGPHHQASARCESGGRNHCTCDVCF